MWFKTGVITMRLLLIIALIIAAYLPNSGAVASQERSIPAIGVGDKLKLTFYARDDISGEYTVQSEGDISIPLLGSFKAEGKTVSQLSDEIVKAFVRDRQDPYQLVIEVVEWRPIYVMGLVDKPGEYAYKPGLTALQAVAIAGGLFRPVNNGMFLGVARESSRIAEVKEQLSRAVAQKIRLEAELMEETVLAPAKGEKDGPNANSSDAAILANQAQVLDWSQTTLQAKVASKEQEITLSGKEVESYGRQLEEVKEQIRLTKTQLSESQSLADRGLTPRLRIIEIQRIIAGLQAEREQVSAALFRAERTKIEANQLAATLKVEHKLKVQQELNDINDRIATLRATLRTAKFVTATMPAIPQQLPDQTSDGITVRIVRSGESSSFSLTEAEQALLKPGDLLIVEKQATEEGKSSSNLLTFGQAKQVTVPQN